MNANNMKNQLVAGIFYTVADLLDIKGENFFKVRAYRLAAQTIEVLEEDIETVIQEKRLDKIGGIGKALATKIEEIVSTGKLDYLERLKQEMPVGLLDMLEIPGLGPKKVAALYQKLQITSIDQLKQACQNAELRNLDGFGEITERNILRGIQLREKTSGRTLLNVAFEDGMKYLEYLQQCKHLKKISLAGSLRRMKETIGDIDILASSTSPKKVMEYFIRYSSIDRVLLQGSTKTSVLLSDGLQVDLRVVQPESFGAALQYFTGSKEHNVKMRSLAIKKGYKLNEYGLFNKKTEKYLVGKDEQEIYASLGMQYIEPELRENRGELEAARSNSLLSLVSYKDIIGDLHVHSLWSDGSDSIENLALTAVSLGYEYLGVSDHSQSLKIAQGLSEEKVKKKISEIKKLNKQFDNLTILCGTECDIKSDGSLDYSNQVLQQFDVVYAGIHTAFKMDESTMTKRIISGMSNENVHCLAHPTGRLLGRRDSYNVNVEQLIETAKDTKTSLEINAFPDRLDLSDIYCKLAKERGVTFIIGTDAHTISHLSFMRFGVATARRGWLEKKDILNTYSLKNMQNMLGR